MKLSRSSLYDQNESIPWPSMNPVLRDMGVMNGSFITESHAILLLTLEEAQQVSDDLLVGIDYFFSFRAAPGNIKDGLDAFRHISKLSTWYNPAQQLIMNFKALSIKAVEYKVNGQSYIKITGYPGLRRILTGTRYGTHHPQILELAIGRRGMFHTIVSGIKYCIVFSLAWRAIEFIFKSDYHLTDFLVDITMDVAKILVSGLVIGAVAGGLVLVTTSIILTTFYFIAAGIISNIGFNILDENLGISDNLKYEIRRKMHFSNQSINTSSLRESLFFNPLLKY
ncbi:hypothetical protein C7387_2547 [Yokenella regensburgei]|uniref:ImpA domain-containing protein n=1 Tax=Yokenella regensburgei TaxID=158877 RepID=A0ABX9RWM0_9ENTR|nr:hypothetical protein [Yokenella regensburgei]RKR54391.1 hypothetical protein C7387_2547 [Yokenella regensburgei]VFS12637.1 Uncharacterised protein [Yokenella regensburgei]